MRRFTNGGVSIVIAARTRASLTQARDGQPSTGYRVEAWAESAETEAVDKPAAH
jgi:hypothetical protein